MHGSLEAYDKSLRRVRRKLIQLLALLIFFLLALAAYAIINRGHFFTGTGSFLSLFGAALVSLIVFVVIRVYNINSITRAVPYLAREDAAVATWLSTDLLACNEAAAAGWSEIRGMYRGYEFRLEHFDHDSSSSYRVSANANSSVALTISRSPP